jgi:type I restriction enzyme S subunit
VRDELVKLKPLSEMCEINMGQSPVSNSYNQAGDGIPFYQGNADFGILHPTVRYWCNEPVKIANEGDILISVRAPIGALNISTEKCCIGRGLAALRAKPGVCNTHYLLYALRSRANVLVASGTGSTFKAISKSTLSGTQIPAPDLETQNIIAKRLDRIIELIALRKQQLDKFDLLVKSRFVEMFDGRGLPQVPLSDCCLRITGGGTPSMKHPEYYGGDVPFIKSGDVRGDAVSSGALWLSKKALTEAKAKFVPRGSILVVNRSAALLSEFRIAVATNPVVINQDIKAFIPKDEYESWYLLLAIRSQTKYLLTKVITVLTSHIALDELLNIPIPAATKDQQAKFADFINQTRKWEFSPYSFTIMEIYGMIERGALS